MPESATYLMRQPCPTCGSREGIRSDRNGQACIFCSDCGKYVYAAPKSETGDPQRNVRTRPEIKPSQRARLLQRDGNCCVMCGAYPPATILHIGHLISVDDGRRHGCTDAELWSDENLAVMCEQCNLGFGRDTVTLKIVCRILAVRVARAQRTA